MTISFNPSPPLSVSPCMLLARLVLKHDDPVAQYAPELLPDVPQTRALGSPSHVLTLLADPKAIWDALIADPTVSDLLDVHGRAYFVIGVRTTNPGGTDSTEGKITELEYVEVTRTKESGITFDYEAPAPVGCTCGKNQTRGGAGLVKNSVVGAAAAQAARAGGIAAVRWAGFTAKGVARGTWAAGRQSAMGNVAKNSWFSRCQSIGATGSLPWHIGLVVNLAASAVVGYALSGIDAPDLCEYCRLQKKKGE